MSPSNFLFSSSINFSFFSRFYSVATIFFYNTIISLLCSSSLVLSNLIISLMQLAQMQSIREAVKQSIENILYYL